MPWQSVEGFFQYEIKVGTIVEASVNVKAKKPAFRLMIDFGPYGLKESSAQITDYYQTQSLVGRQIVAVINFPPRRVASVNSEVLVLGAIEESGAVVLLRPDNPVPNGTSIA
jgi:tRNA-binding protein